VGDCWDGFLTRNGFSTNVPIENPNSGEPPCLKGKEEFSDIGLVQEKIIGKVDTAMFDCTIHQHIVPLV
jgi:hypothetical protein